MTDDQRASADGLSVMDDTRRIFGEGGTQFTNAVATTPLCCPSRASIFSGRYAHNHGVIQQNPGVFNQNTSLQKHLQGLGYTTALVGKYLNNFSGKPPFFNHVTEKAGYYNSSGVYSTNFIGDKAISYMNTFEQTDAKPWLLYVHPIAPHLPATPEKKYEDAFVPAWSLNPARSEADRSDKPPHIQAIKSGESGTKDIRSRMIRTLYTVDDMVVNVMSRLEALGEADNTIVFFMSDNGYMWMEHKLRLKDHAYNDSVRIPMFVRWPGHVEAGAVDDSIVANIDVAATIYDILDYQPGHALDGRSLFSTGERSEILTEGWGYDMPFKALWNPDWMYAEYNNGFKENYAADDPWQLDNGFKTGDPPANPTELASRLHDAATCSGAACP